MLTIGWILGGQVGIGTLAFALLIGPMVNVTLPLLVVPWARIRRAPEEPDEPEGGDRMIVLIAAVALAAWGVIATIVSRPATATAASRRTIAR